MRKLVMAPPTAAHCSCAGTSGWPRSMRATTATPSFVADLAGSYVASLTVSDGVTSSAPAPSVLMQRSESSSM